MTDAWRWMRCLALASCLGPIRTEAQIDPFRRELVQLGYNAAFEGHSPLSVYAFYYRNQPEFVHTNWTLRLALAPTYVDSELGLGQALGPNTDVGIGVAGGGFGDSYNEIRQGKFLPNESFDGHGGGLNASIYHLFNPAGLVPLYWILRAGGHFSTYAPTSNTDPDFQVPDPMGTFAVRTGLRFGGREPILFPALAMELSVWYEGDFRTTDDHYGYNQDRQVESQSHLFWTEAALAYKLPWQHRFFLNLIGGTSVDADRLNAFRLGGFLPLVSEYPLSLPGYYYQELTARSFVLFGGNYLIPIDRLERWNVLLTAATAGVDYLPGFEQPRDWNSGVGGGLLYSSRSWRVMVSYGYGIDAIRSHGYGAQSISFLLQLDLTPAREAFIKGGLPGQWRGFQRLFNVFGN